MKFYLKIPYIVLLAFASYLSAQKGQNTNSYDALESKFYEYYDNNKTKEANEIATQYLNKAKKENKLLQIEFGYNFQSLTQNDEILKLAYLDSIILISEKEPNIYFPSNAYLGKALFYSEEKNYNKALDYYILSEKSAFRDGNIDLAYLNRLNIGIIRNEKLVQSKEAKDLYLSVYAYFSNKKNDEYNYFLESTIFSLADVYKSLKQYDSASYYNQLGLELNKKTKDINKRGKFLLNEAAVNTENKKYTIAIDNIEKALPYITNAKDSLNLLAAYYYYGEAYKGLGKINESVKYFEKVDSMYLLNKEIFPEFIKGYYFLIDHYNSIGEKEKQLYYLNQINKIEQTIKYDYKDLADNVFKQYDIPNLTSEKQDLILSLNKSNRKRNYLLFIFAFLLVIIGYFYYVSKRKQKELQIRFNEIANNTDSIVLEKPKISNTNSQNVISEEVVNDILTQLEKLEQEEFFLQQNLTLSKLSKKLKTNTKYLSWIINEYKGTNFSNYINNLRIKYTINELKRNPTFRNYTISAIAQEVGFNNAESFSNSFKKITELKPSYFINELNKSKIK